ncbi:hypothetical protein CHRY9293_01852 [Chryseobacterium potabilaquae]|uniref:Transposase DDE domain-containing protein n=1 Tax=Chryseobacterium potabilaquae TaxID=2675057 RepID=A0A6N4XB40_9FLAO|nr:hypothetical protein CHRY9293_01852 [Chryseobacterium potabilaquae]
MDLKHPITNIFVQIDDFCKEFEAQIKKMKLQALGDRKKRRNRTSLMSDTFQKLFGRCFLSSGTCQASKC